MNTSTPNTPDLSDEERARLAADTKAIDEVGSLSATGDDAVTGNLMRKRQKTILGGIVGPQTTHLRRPSQMNMDPIDEEVGDEVLPEEHTASVSREAITPLRNDVQVTKKPILLIMLVAILGVGVIGLAFVTIAEKKQHQATATKLAKAGVLVGQLQKTIADGEAALVAQKQISSEESAARLVVEAKLKDITTQKDQLAQSFSDSQLIVTAGREEAGRLKGMLLAAQEKITFLDKERSSVQARAEDQAKQISRIAAELRERGDETQQVRSELAKMEASKQDAENRVRLGQDAISSLTADRDNKVSEIATLTERIEELKALVARMPALKNPATAKETPTPGSVPRPKPPTLPPATKSP